MMSDIGAQEATPFAELERQMMDTNFPKNEREWWSWREINNLRDTITRLTAEVDAMYTNTAPVDAYTDLNSARQDNGSFTAEFKRLTAEAERLTSDNDRLRAALRNVLSYVPHGDMPVTIYDNARAALAEEKQ